MIAEKYGAAIIAYDFKQAGSTAKVDYVSDADALIVNAIYFEANWYHKFNKGFTKKAMFHHSADNKEKVDYINEYRKNRMYAENEVVQVLSLPYKDTSYSFNIFLPKKRFDIDELRAKLDGAAIQNLLSCSRSTYLSKISIPKMKLEKDYELKQALLAMGVTYLFDSASADLSGISKVGLYASDAKHRAFIEVDEEGTTAAAATYIGIRKPMMLTIHQNPKKFIADHPFIFILNKDKNALFIGQFV
ncbi:unnamed protein product [Cylicocyclus nassatus]|uniref:Serpin domain-containing protein n=1 Tax=Cylicocyclus nassatus TaxID=53992 RepID=A0AA36GVZ2_CYLNA|nr:unnamed protein product [Cylicocyclus nassatus]